MYVPYTAQDPGSALTARRSVPRVKPLLVLAAVAAFLFLFLFYQSTEQAGSGISGKTFQTTLPESLPATLQANGQAVVDVSDEETTTSSDPFEELGRCTTLECVSALHPRLRASGSKFNYPHFFLAGWQKSATTSIYRHLRHHPEIQVPLDKEPHYFSSCKFGAPACKVQGGFGNATDYLVSFLGLKEAAASKVGYATFDGSVDYAQKGEWLAPLLAKLFPWLRIVFVFREKVGRSMSYKNMLEEKFQRGCHGDVFKCLSASMSAWGSYAGSTKAWFEAFPASQVHAIQFEELVEDPEGVLRRLKEFLGLDPEMPKRDLANTNRRTSSGGWPIPRDDYEKLVDIAREDQDGLLRVLEERVPGFDGDAWGRRWQKLWDRNFGTCEGSGMCTVASML